MLKKTISMLFVILILTGLGACAQKHDSSAAVAGVQAGEAYYTQFSLFQEKNRYRTTNYRRGFLVPINTPVTVVGADGKNIELKLNESGEPLTIENVSKHTNEDVSAALKKILGKRKVALEQFTAGERKHILDGKVAKGMSRQAVLAALGYPPQIATSSLDSDEWTYWANRYDRFIVHFKNDKVDDIVN